ncbi:hypothetical protein GH890_32410, partial [Bacillus thuringiensis]|nr:hypothetical protein [Bacillus thuringiensis]
KQITSNHFNITPTYLINTNIIQIKITQKTKPNKNNQLPNNKITPYITKLHYSIPNITLISPPPHHNIYSIKNLTQLIFN